MDNPKIKLTTSDIHHSILVLQKLVDKETPKKAILHTSKITDDYYTCPKCRMLLSNDIYCPRCGQKLDWSDE